MRGLSSGEVVTLNYHTTAGDGGGGASIETMDEELNTVSALTYQVRFKASTGTVWVAKGDGACSITVMEVAG